MEKREIDLTVSCYGKVKGVKYDVVILPWELRSPIICICLLSHWDCILPHDIAVDAAALALEFRCTLHGDASCTFFGAHNPG